MKLDALTRFLGVSRSADPFELLGLEAERFQLDQIEAALRNQLAKVDRHPDSGSQGAQQVRDALRQAAMQLANPTVRSRVLAKRGVQPAVPSDTTASLGSEIPQPAAAARPRSPHGLASLGERRLEALRQVRRVRPRVELTPFDRHVLAVLVSCGGWNSDSRSKLVALASAYTVSVQGLLKVVTGLSEYARQGGDRLGVREITAGQSRFRPQARESVGPSAEWVQRMAPAVSRDQRIFALRMAAILSLLVIIAVGVMLLLIVRGGPEPVIKRVEPAINTQQLNRVLTRDADPSPADARAPTAAPATWPNPPTLAGSARPDVAVAALDRMITIEEDLDDVYRRTVVADEPSERIFREWNVLMQDVSECWVLLDEQRRRAVDRCVFDILRAAPNDPSVTDEFLKAITPPPRLDEPLDVWRGAWMAGTLAKIANNPLMPRAAGDRARTLLMQSLGADRTNLPMTFDAAAAAWLDHIVGALVRITDFEQDIDNYWELWLAAEDRMVGADRRQVACMNAIASMLRTNAYVKQSPHANVLGRLLHEADLRNSHVVKDGLSALFNDPDVEVVDLWVLTSLMAQFGEVSWFTLDLVLPQDADYAARSLLAAEIDRRWPVSASDAAPGAAAGRPIVVDAAAAVRWFELLQTFEQQSMHTADAPLMRQLIVAVWFNQAAARMANMDVTGANMVMDRIERELSDDDDANADGRRGGVRTAKLSSQTPVQGIGVATGPDGQWARAFERANSRTKLELLQSLRQGSTGDLGPVDARAFAHAAYRGPSREVRLSAQQVAREFAHGPNVLVELVNQFPNRPGGQDIAGMIANITGRRLPGTDSPAWAAEARLALIEHVLELKDKESQIVTMLGDELAAAYVGVLEAITRAPAPQLIDTDGPNAAAQRLTDAWRKRAGEVVVADPYPDTLAVLGQHTNSRLRLAEAAPQRLVAWRLAALELATYVAVAEQPRLRQEVTHALSESAANRRNMGHVIQQAVEVERAMARVWALRLTFEAREEFSGKEAPR